MAKLRARNVGKSKGSGKKVKKKGPTSTADVKKTKSLDEILGVEPLELTEEEGDDEPDVFQSLSPKSSLKEILQQKIAEDFSHFLSANRACQDSLGSGKRAAPPILRFGGVIRNLEGAFSGNKTEQKVRISDEDIAEEISYWQSAIVCYVLGANPPLSVLDGFARRIWKGKVDKIGMISYGIFIIRFDSCEFRDEVLSGGYIFFNKRPVIMKAWDPDVNLRKEDVRSVPVWVQLEDLELKYWGERRQGGKKQEWVVKEKKKEKVVEDKGKMVDNDGFRQVANGWRKIGQNIVDDPQTSNAFNVLDEIEGHLQDEGILNDEEWPKESTVCMKQQEVKNFIEKHRIGLVGLLETRVKAPKLGALYMRMFRNWCFTSNIAWAKGGRMIVAWNPGSYHVDIIFCSSQLVHLRVTTIDKRNCFYVSFVYGFNHEEGRNVLWKDLIELKRQEPWIVLGDFNDILEKGERIGKREHYSHSKFKDCVGECQLEDVKQSGSFFTWNNKQQGEERVYSKIDRIMANQRWLETYENAEALFLNEGLFDHTPAILTLFPTILNGRKPFKFFGCGQVILLFNKRWGIHGRLLFRGQACLGWCPK
uniref:DUF4283 domain-containing protein n=1 Tax=Cannabis sativa TaxID=3483 RepID=A0A803PSL1_CANSA